MKNILVYITINTQFKFILPVVKFIIENKIGNPIILLDNQIHNLEKEKEYCLKQKINLYEKNKKTIVNNTKLSINTKKSNNIKNEIKDVFFLPYRLLRQLYFFNEKKKSYIGFLKKNAINLLILTEQGLGYDCPFITAAAKTEKIPSVVFPFAVTTDEVYQSRFRNDFFSCQKLSNAVLSFLLPKRTKTIFNNKKLIVAAPYHVLALKFTKMLPKNPWSVYSGNADYINAESEFLKKFLIKEKINPKKIISLGSLKFDVKMSNNFKNEYILCAFPPLNYHENLNLPEFNNNKDAVKYWFNVLARYSSNYKVIISLHPRLRKENFIEIAEKYNFEISSGTIEDLIKDCKLFITSVSSTIRLAIAYRKPVLDYDIYGFDYPNFKKYQGVITIFTKTDFEYNLSQLVNNQSFFEDIKKKQKKDAEYFGRFDNKNAERLNNFLRQIL